MAISTVDSGGSEKPYFLVKPFCAKAPLFSTREPTINSQQHADKGKIYTKSMSTGLSLQLTLDVTTAADIKVKPTL